MATNFIYDKGSIIIEFGQAFVVFKTETKKNIQGKQEKYIYYRPYFLNDQNRSLVYSFPESSGTKLERRNPISRQELSRLLTMLSLPLANHKPVDVDAAKMTFKSNNVSEKIKLFKRLWFEKNHSDKDFSYVKKTAYTQTLQQLVEEIAVVFDLSIAAAKEKLLSHVPRVAQSRVAN